MLFRSKLIIDRYFGVYNRNGFEYIIRENIEGSYKVYLVDFDNIKGLNSEKGYKFVNELFKKTLSLLKEEYIIGRAFSGDEIFFLTKNLDDNINNIRTICNENGLHFNHIELINEGEDSEEFLEKMINNFR